MDQTAIKFGGAKRKNGHKMNCECHICQNMKNKAKRGGYEEDAEKERLKKMGGSTKKNGHKPNCNCPICKNMRNAKKTMKADKSSKSGKKSNGHKMNCKCPICKNMGKKGGSEVEATKDEYDNIDDVPKANTKSDTSTNNTPTPDNNLQKGGLKIKSLRKRGNGHKANCMCPICKNMRKGSKTRRR